MDVPKILDFALIKNPKAIKINNYIAIILHKKARKKDKKCRKKTLFSINEFYEKKINSITCCK